MINILSGDMIEARAVGMNELISNACGNGDQPLFSNPGVDFSCLNGFKALLTGISTEKFLLQPI